MNHNSAHHSRFLRTVFGAIKRNGPQTGIVFGIQMGSALRTFEMLMTTFTDGFTIVIRFARKWNGNLDLQNLITHGLGALNSFKSRIRLFTGLNKFDVQRKFHNTNTFVLVR